jgi:hypothetical protein
LESLQPERLDTAEAMAALVRGGRSIVTVDVESETSALAVTRSFRENGYAPDFFRCNCRCHDGHVAPVYGHPVTDSVRLDTTFDFLSN